MAALLLLFLIMTVLTVAAATLVWFSFVTNRIAAGAELAVPPIGKFLEVEGNRIHYLDVGEGRPILFIHGLGGWLQQLSHPLFERLGGNYRLISLDRPGSGYSTRAKGLTGRLPEQADQLAAFIDALGLDRPMLVGHSLGGAIALTVALRHPDKISGLALISPLTSHVAETPPEFAGLKIRSPGLRRLFAHTLAVPLAARYAKATLDFIFGPQQPPADYAIAGGAFVGLRPGHFYATSTDYVALDEDMPQQETRYGEIGMPVGILFGTEDRVLDYRKQGLAMEAKLPGLDLEIIEGVGHMPQYAVADRVLAFIRRMADKAFTDRGGGSASAAR
jgi:pimeloyl-ACP methyl ester carboxylesterase